MELRFGRSGALTVAGCTICRDGWRTDGGREIWGLPRMGAGAGRVTGRAGAFVLCWLLEPRRLLLEVICAGSRAGGVSRGLDILVDEPAIGLLRGFIGAGRGVTSFCSLLFWLRRNNSRRCFSSAVSVAPAAAAMKQRLKTTFRQQIPGNFKLIADRTIIIK